MNRTRMLILAVFAVAVSAGATWLAYTVLSPQFAPSDETVDVVSAIELIPRGSAIEATQLQIVRWPRAAALTGSFSKIEDVVDRGLIATVYPNEPILESKLAPEGVGVGLNTTIPEGMRAVSVSVNEVIGVAGFVLPGTVVDVIVAGSPVEGRETDTAKLFLENVEVLAVGQNVEQVNGEPQEVQVITLLVSPEDAQRLALASVDGRIQLALRNPLDVDPADPAPVVRHTLYERRGVQAAPPRAAPPTASQRVAPRAPAPPPPPPPPPAPPKPVPFTVDVLQGNERQAVTYDLSPETAPEGQ